MQPAPCTLSLWPPNLPSTSAKWTMVRNGHPACTPPAGARGWPALMHCHCDHSGLAAIASCRPACNTHASCPSRVLRLVLKHGKYTNLLTDFLGCLPAPKSCRAAVQLSVLAAHVRRSTHHAAAPPPLSGAPFIFKIKPAYRQFSAVGIPSLHSTIVYIRTRWRRPCPPAAAKPARRPPPQRAARARPLFKCLTSRQAV